MSERDKREAEEAGFDTGPLPEVLERLCDAMQGVDPDWRLEEWLINIAEEEISLLKMDIERERLRLEQRMHRVESIAQRIEPEEVVEQGQRNLFDCFDLVKPPVSEPHIRAVDLDGGEEPHPAKALLSYLPGEIGDDPLLAVVAQLILLEMDALMDTGLEVVRLNEILGVMNERGIGEDEVDEAIDHLLLTGAIHEIDDDCFIPDE